MIKLIDHIGIVVESVEKSLAIYTDALGLNLGEIETNETFGVKIAFLTVGDTLVELIEPIAEGTMASDFLKKQGEGIHHIAFRVDNISSFLTGLKKMGLPLVHETPQPGGLSALVAFMHPSVANNVNIEFIERSEQ